MFRLTDSFPSDDDNFEETMEAEFEKIELKLKELKHKEQELKEIENNNAHDWHSSSYTKLPSDADSLLHICSFFNQSDFAKISRALKGDNGLSNIKIALAKISTAGKLLKATEYADYNHAENLIADNVDLMFEPVGFKFRDGSEEQISPLGYAFKVYDTYMWKTVFLKRIEKIEDSTQKEQALKKFYAQMQKQNRIGHINLEPLFQAYQEYDRQHQLWLENKISSQELNEEWSKLATNQIKILPIHMLKEFSRYERNGWQATNLFDVQDIPPPLTCSIYDYNQKKLISLASILANPNWSFSLARGRRDFAMAPKEDGSGFSLPDLARYDLNVFRSLFNKRELNFKTEFLLMAENYFEKPENIIAKGLRRTR